MYAWLYFFKKASFDTKKYFFSRSSVPFRNFSFSTLIINNLFNNIREEYAQFGYYGWRIVFLQKRMKSSVTNSGGTFPKIVINNVRIRVDW